MNFLAHIYLSGENEKLMVGNFIGDYVKGKKYNNYPSLVRDGIILHRKIDYFTDKHHQFKEAKKLLLKDFGLYSGVVVDLFYDHLLAKKWDLYSNLTLREFAKRSHAVLLSNFLYLPKRVQGFLPILIQNRRLESYATKKGIHDSLNIMSRYTSFPGKANIAMEILEENIIFYEKNFTHFFSEMIEFMETHHNIVLKKPDLITGL